MVFLAILSINIDALYSSLLIVFSKPEKYTVPSPGHKNTSKRHSEMSKQTTTSMQSFLDSKIPSRTNEFKRKCKLQSIYSFYTNINTNIIFLFIF